MGMQSILPVPQASQLSVQTTRQLIRERSFCHRHRSSERGFTRRRRLTFMRVVALLLQKTVRSIHGHLQDFFEALDLEGPAVSASAWCEARLKLRHTAFIELNERAVLDVAYGVQSDFAVRRWKGHRVLGLDSSLIRLPNRPELGEHFGWVSCSNQAGSAGRYPQARLSVLTDVLNRIAIHTLCVPWEQGERDLVVEHLALLQPDDVGLLDRGFASYELFAQFIVRQRSFVCRCPTSSFSVVNQLYADNQAGRSVIVVLQPSSWQRAAMRRAGLPEEIRVRFVSVRLSTGELEVLATNLLDESLYPAQEFLALYGYRWGIETFYGLIKGRLDLEHFSGWSVEAVRQDLYATIFLSNLESVLIQPAQEQLRQPAPERQQCRQVNHAVSFHAIKSRIIALLLSEQPLCEVLAKLQRLFLGNPVSQRPDRKVTRHKGSIWRAYQYQRNVRKPVF